MGQATGRVEEYDIEARDEVDAPEQIETQRAQIEHTRAEMSETIDAIKEKLNPHHLAQQAKETVREATIGRVEHAASSVAESARQAANSTVEGAERIMSTASETAREYGSTITETIQRNPMPAALIGAGLGWLWWNARQQSSGESINKGRPIYDYSSQYEAPYSYETQPAGASALRDTAEKAKDRMEDVAGQVQQKASDVSASVRHQAERATDNFGRWMHENPLAVGAMALALGAAVGMAIPETRQEQRMMGDARDRLTEQARQTAREVKQKVQAVAQEAMDTAKEEARSQGLTG